MQDVIHTQSQSVGAGEAVPIASERHVEPRLKLSLSDRLALVGKILISSFRRFLYRIRSIRAYKPVDFGPALQRSVDGSFVPCDRTDFRIQSIDNVLAKYRWADIEDARMFLEGFDAGEAWSRRTSDR